MSEKFDLGFISQGFSFLTSDAQQFFGKMTEAEWNAWQPRYHALLDMANGNQRVLPDITWWEQAFLTAMLAHAGMADQLKKI